MCEVTEVTGTWRRRGEGTEMGHNLQWAVVGFALGKGGLGAGLCRRTGGRESGGPGRSLLGGTGRTVSGVRVVLGAPGECVWIQEGGGVM